MRARRSRFGSLKARTTSVPHPRPRFRLRLRTLVILVAAVAVGLGVWSEAVQLRRLSERYRQHRSGYGASRGFGAKPPRVSVSELVELLGLGRTTTKAALRRAVGVGLIGVRRDPGRKLVLSLRNLPADGPEPKPLRGPIPWAWWAAASLLPGPSLRVGAVCWLVAGRQRSAEFVLGSGDWSELGLSRFAVWRGLGNLNEAGLVSVTRLSGRPSIVHLRNARNDPRAASGL